MEEWGWETEKVCLENERVGKMGEDARDDDDHDDRKSENI